MAGSAINARVAQLVEQRIENPRVGGSNPPPGTTFLRQIIIKQRVDLDYGLRNHLFVHLTKLFFSYAVAGIVDTWIMKIHSAPANFFAPISMATASS